MARPEHRQPLPEWARQERVSDLAWLGENLHVLWPAAERSYRAEGRGAVVIDTTQTVEHENGAGNPMFYLNEEVLAQAEAHPDALRMVRTYDPTWELVTVLVKRGRESAYRIGVPAALPPASEGLNPRP